MNPVTTKKGNTMFNKLEDVKDWANLQLRTNPMEFLAGVAAAVTAVAKVTDSAVSLQNSRTWKKEVKRRTKMNKATTK